METITLEEQLRRRPVNAERVAAFAAEIRQQVRSAQLKEIRESQELTQVQLARELHVSQNRISQIECGNIDKTRVETLRKYVEALGGKLRIEVSLGESRIVVG